MLKLLDVDMLVLSYLFLCLSTQPFACGKLLFVRYIYGGLLVLVLKCMLEVLFCLCLCLSHECKPRSNITEVWMKRSVTDVFFAMQPTFRLECVLGCRHS